MLVLSRKVGEAVYIQDEIKITVLSVRGNRVRIGFEAPDDVDIARSELVDWSNVQPESAKSPSWREADVDRRSELTFSI